VFEQGVAELGHIVFEQELVELGHIVFGQGLVYIQEGSFVGPFEYSQSHHKQEDF